MTAISAVPPIDNALHLAKAPGAIDRPSAPPAELTQKFASLMQRTEVPRHATAPTGQNVLGTMLGNAQAKLATSESHLDNLIAALPGMDPSEASAASAMVAQEIGAASAQVQIATAMVSASKGSIDSLLKNQ